MKLEYREIAKMVCATLLSLAIYNIATHLLDWGSVKCPWDAKRVKFVSMIVIGVVAGTFLLWHYRQALPKKQEYRKRVKVLAKNLQTQVPLASSA